MFIFEYKGESNAQNQGIRCEDIPHGAPIAYHIDKGIYYSYLYFKQGTNILRIDSRTSDAIALAIRMHAPIFTYEDIIENERARNAEQTDTTFMGHDAPKNEEPVKSYSQLQRLEDDLQKAIDAEEYELAAKLRDIISKLKEDQ